MKFVYFLTHILNRGHEHLWVLLGPSLVGVAGVKCLLLLGNDLEKVLCYINSFVHLQLIVYLLRFRIEDEEP